MKLMVPALDYLSSYVSALESGWSPDNVRGREASEEQLELIRRDRDSFLASLDDPEARGAPIKLPDGSLVSRLPGIVRWMWDGEFCGSIGFRWQEGTAALPPTCLGHIGFSVVPWKQRRGYATAALALMLDEARARKLPYVELTTDPDNIASRRVIEANGGTIEKRFQKDSAYGASESLLFKIEL